jgi:3-oxoacyl-[acyl-carrier-protein] synthase II
MNNAAAGHISIDHGLRGPSFTYSTACSSSAIAIGEAYRAIRHGYVDAAIAGGAESLLTLGTIRAWEALRTLAVTDTQDPAASCRPFSKDRTGLVLAEGAGMLVLETLDRASRRGARIHAEVIGYGAASDASHLTRPGEEGQVRAIRLALADAGSSPDEIDYINAHGTATLAGDVIETLAIKKVFGERAAHIPVSSTKSMHGHLMGAVGAVEFIASIMAIGRGAVPPTANLRVPDPECDLDYVPNIGRPGVAVRTVMSNSFAFGGSNAVLIGRSFDR